MRPLERVTRTRRELAAAIAIRGLLWAATAVFAAGALWTAAVRRGLIAAAASWLGWVAALVLGVSILGLLLRSLRALTVPRVALWIEERVPRLEYALVTAVDAAAMTAPAASLLDPVIDRVSWAGDTRSAMARSLVAPASGVVMSLALLLSAQRVMGAAEPSNRDLVTSTPAASRGTPAPFARLTATVRTPAYAGGEVVRIERPASITALVGSRVMLEAPGAGDGVTAELDDRALPLRRDGGGWQVSLVIGARPALVRLRHPSGARIVALEPRVDSAPVVRLEMPARDTVMRVARGTIPLEADVRDDIGLVGGAFEYIVSSGEGESFQFRSGTLGTRRFEGAPRGSLTASLPLDALALKPGDLVHLRAVARDGNTVSGPGTGASETRVLRVARAGEYDSIAVEGAPPPEADKSLISQRMLIMQTEALDRRRPRVSRETLLSESRAIARDQTRLRRRVGDIIFARLGDDPSGEHGHGPDEEPAAADAAPPDAAARDSARRAIERAGRSAREAAAADSADSARAALLRAASAATGGGDEILDFEGDETPVVAINRPLLEAYNAMWEASRELEQGETARALPPMRRALAAIQRARQAERIYLRGKAPAVVVDLARVRLTGKDSGTPGARSPRPPADPAAARRTVRVVSAIALAGTGPAAAIDSLVLLRVEALDAAPALAAALGDAIDAMRRNRDATALLARVRRVAEGELRGAAPIGAWSGSW